VKSAVIRLKRNNVETLECDEKLFVRVVKAGFNQRRKTLRNALKSLNYNLDSVPDKFLKARAEQLSSDEFIELTKILENSQNNV
jgi:16S rRNA (adenine1518-N6/adenine1519-N6)-dimethyltransferase